jgi:hypothetical protein
MASFFENEKNVWRHDMTLKFVQSNILQINQANYAWTNRWKSKLHAYMHICFLTGRKCVTLEKFQCHVFSPYIFSRFLKTFTPIIELLRLEGSKASGEYTLCTLFWKQFCLLLMKSKTTLSTLYVILYDGVCVNISHSTFVWNHTNIVWFWPKCDYDHTKLCMRFTTQKHPYIQISGFCVFFFTQKWAIGFFLNF